MSLDAALGDTLLEVARASIEHGLDHDRALPVAPADYDPALRPERATFVTLLADDKLRGCIGTLEASLPLVVDVAEHAFAAGFRDPRFPALRAHEMPALDIHISILTPSTPIRFESEPDLLSQLRPGVDGLTIGDGLHKATFLPSVWESLPDPAQFLAHLKHKAGMPADLARFSAWRYGTENIARG